MVSNRVPAFLEGAQEHRVGRERPVHLVARLLGGAHGGLDDLDLLHAEGAAVAGMRVQAVDRDARALDARLLEAVVRELHLGEDRLDRQVVETLLQRMCEVTRAFQTFSRTLNSRTLPAKPVTSTTKRISSS